jgi:hypothetical protein
MSMSNRLSVVAAVAVSGSRIQVVAPAGRQSTDG